MRGDNEASAETEETEEFRTELWESIARYTSCELNSSEEKGGLFQPLKWFLRTLKKKEMFMKSNSYYSTSMSQFL